MSPQLFKDHKYIAFLTTDIITEKNVLILSNLSIPLTDFSLRKNMLVHHIVQTASVS